jgi:hypothetical protein
MIWTGRLLSGPNYFAMQVLMNVTAPRYVRLVRTAAIAASLTPFTPRGATFNSYVSVTCNYIRWSSSNSRWKQRQGKDFFAREAKVQGLKSRAAFKLLEVGYRHLHKPCTSTYNLDATTRWTPSISYSKGARLSLIW